MKLRQVVLALSLSLFAGMAAAETGYVGSGNGPLLSTNGCVMSANGGQFAECGGSVQPTEPVAVAPRPQAQAKPQAPRVVTRVIVDCSKCGGKKGAKSAAKKAGGKKMMKRGGKRLPNLRKKR